jgi:hypothetical protein
VTAARTYLLEALKRVADGGDIAQQELDAAVPDPFILDRDEKKAWEELSHWADDADIRERDENYAGFKRDWMRDRIRLLNSKGS